MKKNKAFTLIELLVVVLIIGILSAVALPQYQKAVDKTRFNSMLSIIRSLGEAKKVYYLANGEHARTFDVLDVELPANCATPTADGWYGEAVNCKTYTITLDSSSSHQIRATFIPKSSSCQVDIYFTASSAIKGNECYAYGLNGCDYLCKGLSPQGEPTPGTSNSGQSYNRYNF